MGLERLRDEMPAELRGRRVGLLSNVGAVDRDLTPSVEVLRHENTVKLERLFAGEHGIYGELPAGAPVVDRVDEHTGLDVVSLYAHGHHLDPSRLDGLDAVLIDVQDIGCRYYTVLGTAMALVAACAQKGIPAYVLDRPNPLGGAYEGQPAVEEGYRSLVGYMAIPMRHGLTIGELVRLAAREAGLLESVKVVPMDGWRRDFLWDDLERSWVPPSPNSSSTAMARLYPATCLVEGTNLSEGRGTASPFELAGAPWLDSWKMAEAVNAWAPPGLRARPATFVPVTSKLKDQVCQGVMIHLEPRRDVAVVDAGVALIRAALAWPETRFLGVEPEEGEEATKHHGFFDLLAGNDRLREDLRRGRPVPEIVAEWNEGLRTWPEETEEICVYGRLAPRPGVEG